MGPYPTDPRYLLKRLGVDLQKFRRRQAIQQGFKLFRVASLRVRLVSSSGANARACELVLERLEQASTLAASTDGHPLFAEVDYELAKLYEADGDAARTERVLTARIAASRRAGDRYFLPRYLGEYAAFNAKAATVCLG